jgi:chromosome segregation ATPase
VHVLTKIFIVLVSLMAVLLVPLVVVYAYNEDSFRAKFQGAEARHLTSQQALQAAEARAGAEQSRLEAQIAELRSQLSDSEKKRIASETSANELRSQLAATETTQAMVVSDIGVIKQQIETGHQLTASLVAEVRDLRTNAVALERQKVELDGALSDTRSQLEVAEQARRALAEELTRLKDEHNRALTKLSQYVAQHGDLNVRAGMLGERGLIPDKTLTANIIRVERNSGQVLAEIDAGSRDGVKEGWSMTIASGGNFIANLKIINVDINRATGVISLEKKDRGWVQVGHTAHAVAGQD